MLSALHLRPISAASIATASVLLFGCPGVEPITKTAVVPFAYSDDSAPFNALVGRGAKPGDGTHPTLTELPTQMYFDPHGYQLQPLNGQTLWDDATKKGLAAGISASVTNACAGSLGVAAGSVQTDNATVTPTETLGLDPTERRYTPQLKYCCESYDHWSCRNWVVNRAFKTKVTWTVTSDGNIGAAGNISCGSAPPPVPAVSSAAPPPASASASSAPSAAPSASAPAAAAPSSSSSPVPSASAPAAPASSTVAAVAPTPSGFSASVNVNSENHHKADITSEGWNVVEVIPLKQVCAEWKSVKAQNCGSATPEVRKQLLCD